MNSSKHRAFVIMFAVVMATCPIHAAVVNLTQSSSGYMTDGNTYIVSSSITLSGMTVADNATVVLNISKNAARIDMDGGTPLVSWSPDLNEGGTKAERVYTVEGKETLSDETWDPTNAATRFFRVKVGMP